MIRPSLPIRRDWTFAAWLLSLALIGGGYWHLRHGQRQVERKIEQLEREPFREAPPLPVGNLRVFPQGAISAKWGNGVARSLEEHEARLKALESSKSTEVR